MNASVTPSRTNAPHDTTIPKDPSLPFVCFVVGPAGSGKSTVARAIAKQMKAALLDKDSLGEELVDALLICQGSESGEREGNDYYRNEVMPLEYQALFRMAQDNLSLGMDVVIDAPFAAYVNRAGYFEEMSEQASWPAVQAIVAHVATPAEVVHSRLVERGLHRDRWKLANWDQFWQRFASTRSTWTKVTHIDIDNTNGPQLAPLLRILGRPAK